jgi:hypothetical protein
MYVDHFKVYQEFFGEVVNRMKTFNEQWEQARFENLMDCALQTKDYEWCREIQEERS